MLEVASRDEVLSTVDVAVVRDGLDVKDKVVLLFDSVGYKALDLAVVVENALLEAV